MKHSTSQPDTLNSFRFVQIALALRVTKYAFLLSKLVQVVTVQTCIRESWVRISAGTPAVLIADSCLVGCCTVHSGICWPTFQRSLLIPSTGCWVHDVGGGKFCETLVCIYQTPLCSVLQDSHLYSYHRENFIPHLHWLKLIFFSPDMLSILKQGISICYLFLRFICSRQDVCK
jgi:hypothetical protein